jgi:hypothetical protein
MYQSNQIDTNSSIARVISLQSELARLKAENATMGEIIPIEQRLEDEAVYASRRVLRHMILQSE